MILSGTESFLNNNNNNNKKKHCSINSICWYMRYDVSSDKNVKHHYTVDIKEIKTLEQISVLFVHRVIIDINKLCIPSVVVFK